MSRFIIIGPPRSGKTTIGRAIAHRLGTVCTDTSDALVAVETERQRIFKEYLGKTPCTSGLAPENVARLWDDQRDRPVRPHLIALGDAMKIADPTILGRYCFERGDVCVGVRRQDELDALAAAYFDLVVIRVQTDMATEADNTNIRKTPQHTLTVWNPRQDTEQARTAQIRNIACEAISFAHAFVG